MKIALVQMAMAADVLANTEKTYRLLKEAAAQGADLAVFPEIQLTRFFPQYEGRDVSAYAMTLDDPFIQKMRALCKEHHIMAAPNVYLMENGRYYDATLLISEQGEILGVQKMVHIAQAEQFYEQDYYAPADDGFKVFDTTFGAIGIVVCFDRHYPESIRTEALMGADLILIPTANTMTEPEEMFDWEIRVQAFQSSVAVAMCNRCGLEDGMTFSGHSIVCDAAGDIVARAGVQEEILYAELSPEDSGKVRRQKPYTQLRRTELYK